MYIRNKDARQSLRIRSSIGLHSDSLTYMVSEPMDIVFRPERTLDKYREELTGKVAIIERTWPGGMTADRYYTSIAYREAVKTILGQQFTQRWDGGWFWMSLLVIGLSWVFALLLRPFQALQVLMALTIASFAAGYLMFDRMDIVVDILYPCLTALLCAFIFPFAKAADEARKLEAGKYIPMPAE